MRLACLLLIAACGTNDAPRDVVGPFTGDVHTYYVDSFVFPQTSIDARNLGDDLNGDKTVDNQLGATTAGLANFGNDLTTHTADMIASGVLRSTFEIHADDRMDDATVGVRYLGAPGADAVEVGGTLIAGTFVSNRTATAQHLGKATVHLPILEDIDPMVFDLQYMELDLAPDGSGGYNVRVRGLVGPEILQVGATAVATMIAANPPDHDGLVQILDPDHTGKLDALSLADNPSMKALLASDTSRDRVDYVTFGFGLHLSPNAPSSTPADLCHDRVQDANETDVDCGGSCLACAGGATCGSAADCQSQQCAGGMCLAATCHDGVRDGLESDVDCGGWECPACVR